MNLAAQWLSNFIVCERLQTTRLESGFRISPKRPNWRMIYNFYILINNILLSYIIWKQKLLKFVAEFPIIALNKDTIFAKSSDFLRKNAEYSLTKGRVFLIFFKPNMCVYLCVKCHISIIFLTGFRRGTICLVMHNSFNYYRPVFGRINIVGSPLYKRGI